MLFRISTSLIFFILFLSGCSSRSNYVQYYPSSGSGSSYDSSTYSTPKSSKVIDTPAMHRATMRPYTINGKTYYPTRVSVGDTFSGVASWYGPDFHGKKTSNGEYYNMYDMTAAHKTLPMNTVVRVTNLENNKNVVVRINDRGPFVRTRIIDLSNTAAKRIDMIRKGTAPVRLDVIGFGGKISDGTTSSPQSVEGGNFLVQIGAFRREQGAYIYKDRYNNTNGRYKTVVMEGFHQELPMYRVYLSGFQSEDEARDFASSGQFSGAFIIRDTK